MTVEELFIAYARAFEAYDAKAAASLYAFPAHVASDAGGDVRLTALPSADVFVPMLVKLMEKYRRDGVKKIRALSLDVTEHSPRLRTAALHWGMRGLADLPLYDFDTHYLVARVDNDWKIVSAMSPNELSRYRAFIGRG